MLFKSLEGTLHVHALCIVLLIYYVFEDLIGIRDLTTDESETFLMEYIVVDSEGTMRDDIPRHLYYSDHSY